MGGYRREFRVSWADLDANAHMANRAFLDCATETRLSYLAEHGFAQKDFAAAGVGPVTLHDDIVYRKELRHGEEFTVNVLLAGINADGSRFRIRNEFFAADGTIVASVTTDGIWFDLRARRRGDPPEPLLAALKSIEHSADFLEIA